MHSSNLEACGWQFPPELEEFALGLVHHSVLRLDDLIDYIHEAVKPRAIATQGRDNDLQPEKLKHPAPRPVIRCWLFEVSMPSCTLLPDLSALARFQITRCLMNISQFHKCISYYFAGGCPRASWGLPKLLACKR